MRYIIQRGRTGRALVVLSALLFAASGCQELQVDNLVDPDRGNIFANPEDVQTLIGGAFLPNLWGAMTESTVGGFALAGLYGIFPGQASELSSTLASGLSAQWYLDMVEPRQPHQNASVIAGTIGPWGPRTFWAHLGAAGATPYDGLFLLENGIVIEEDGVDVTARARAFAKLVQGWAWGYGALMFDRINIVPETIDLASLSFEELSALPIASLKPYDEAILDALAAIDEAIAVAEQNPSIVNFPQEGAGGSPWFGTATPVSNAQFIQIANTLAARLLVLNARNPEEREDVDWARVLQYTAKGIQNSTNDLEVLNGPGGRAHIFLGRAQGNSGGTITFGAWRWDHRAIGPADQSGNYQNWIAAEPAARNKFLITTPDRRITGPTPDSHGSYTRYRSVDTGFIVSRGTYFLGHYQFSRHAIENNLPENGSDPGSTIGTHTFVSADENRLLRAEAIIRTQGVTQEAVDLINVTRTRQQTLQDGSVHPGLPPLTVAGGVPTVNGACVPRMDNGECGTVRSALRYERMIELAVTDVVRGFADSRGFGLHPDGTLEHYPIPGNVIEQYELPEGEYTYGGVGTEWGAVYAPWN